GRCHEAAARGPRARRASRQGGTGARGGSLRSTYQRHPAPRLAHRRGRVPRIRMRPPHIAYVCADRGIPIIGTKGGSTHIREMVNALSARGAELRVLAARPTDGASRNALRADLLDVGSDRFGRALRTHIRRIAPGARPGRVRTVCNAADPDRFRSAPRPTRNGGPRDPFVIGFVGSLKPWHGIQDLLRAFVRLRRRSSAYRLLVVGDGPLRPAIERIRRREGLTDAIRVTGNVDYARVPALVAEMDVALAPYPRLSAFYFSPLKVYEYMAAGVPIVASAIGQVTEILTHRRTALLHPAGSINKIVDHIE